LNKTSFCLAYLGLGGNLGDPIEQLISARSALLALPKVLGGRCSYFYSSSPVGYDDQPDFINCVLELKVTSSALELLDDMQSIETDLGRKRVVNNQNAPRLIDIDLLLFGNQVIESERLIVPHPRMKDRLFVLRPLLELLEDNMYRTCLRNGKFEDQMLTQLAINPMSHAEHEINH
jgi:2-amino-4-hydroxy-6-hydroxymethyldihydropteridine diphosphokinase